MKFVTVRDFRSRPASVWRRLANGEQAVVTSNGKPVALLTPCTEDTLQESLRSIQKARALTAIMNMQATSAKRGNERMALSEINSEIQATRRSRRK